MNILVYQDEGAGEECSKNLIKYLTNCTNHKVIEINANEILENNWQEDCILLAFPGGRDTPYHEKLKGEANNKIKEYVESGGNYLGICAGAYYGSKSFEFAKGQELEIIANRELGFFPGIAYGPVYASKEFNYENDSGARVVEIQAGGNKIYSYYNGGCFFKEAEDYKNVEVLATYKDLKPAIIDISVGQGRVLLSGVHFECDQICLANQTLYNSSQEILSSTATLKNSFIKELLRSIKIYVSK